MNFSDKLFGKQEPVKPWILDRSTLERFAECPYQAKAAMENPAIVGECAQVGTEVHRLIAEALEWCKNDPDSTPADYFQQEAPKSRPDIQPQVLTAARNVAAELGRINLGRIMGVEYQVDYQLPGQFKGRPAKITTAIDLLMRGAAESVLIVDDWKSGFKKRSNAEARETFQAQFIALILFKLYPTVDTIHFWYIETRWGTKAYAKFIRKEIEGFGSLTTEQAILARIMESVRYWSEDSKEAWPEPTKCCWCDYVAVCPHATPMAKDLATDEKGFVDQYYVLKALLKKMEVTATEVIKSGKKTVLHGSKAVLERKKPVNKFTLGQNKNGDEDGEKE